MVKAARIHNYLIGKENLVPHKPIIPWTKSVGPAGTDIDYNRCDSCGKSTGDAIHRLEFRGNPISYRLFLEQR